MHAVQGWNQGPLMVARFVRPTFQDCSGEELGWPFDKILLIA